MNDELRAGSNMATMAGNQPEKMDVVIRHPKTTINLIRPISLPLATFSLLPRIKFKRIATSLYNPMLHNSIDKIKT
jgi:hypothetical protein